MVVRTITKSHYCPVARSRPAALISGSRRVRYVRVFLLVNPQRSKTVERRIKHISLKIAFATIFAAAEPILRRCP
jgi:hypothetical protein